MSLKKLQSNTTMSQRSSQGSIAKGDVSYLRATSGPQLPVPPSPLPPGRDNNHTPGAPQPHSVNNDWEDRLELQQRELEEVRARAAQMEKTMRWWSDCTANWREKWSKVRNERNKAREENRQLRAKLDSCIKELNHLKREKDEMKKDSNSDNQAAPVSDSLSTSPSHVSEKVNEAKSKVDGERAETLSDCGTSTGHSIESSDVGVSVRQSLSEKGTSMDIELTETRKGVVQCEVESGMVEDRMALLELKLDESQKTISGERDEKSQLVRSLESLQAELNAVKLKYEELKLAKRDLEAQLERTKDQHQDDMRRLATDLEDEQSTKTVMDKRLSDLRVELEKLQKENADEWGRRERLETDKLALEREIKKLRAHTTDLEEQLERKSTHATTVVNKDMKTLQMELSEKNKEVADLRHLQTKLKKTLQERTTDLEHSRRRCDQFEAEVKKLRSRVDELKRDLTTAEDEADTQANHVRKIQRNNDELQEHVENLQVQIEHLQSRLRRSSHSGATTHSASVRSFSPDLQALEIDDDTDDDFSEGN